MEINLLTMILTPQTFPQVSINQTNSNLTLLTMNDFAIADWIDEILEDDSLTTIIDIDDLCVESMEEQSEGDY